MEKQMRFQDPAMASAALAEKPGREWSPGAAQFALKELRAVADFFDTMRARALEPSAPKPSDFEAN
jgi:hypothetical protein